MAYEPCDCHGRLFRGKSARVYPAAIAGGQRYGEPVRVCPPGLATYTDFVSRHLDEIVDGASTTTREEPVCGFCGVLGPAEPVMRLFCTTYPDGKTRHDYSGWACKDCGTAAVTGMLLHLP